jgi:hypothetical protein
MKRDTLYTYLRRLVIASLPLAVGGCPFGNNCPTHNEWQVVVDGGLPDGMALDDAGCEAICTPDPESPTKVHSCEASTTDGSALVVQCHGTTPCLGRRSFDTVVRAPAEPNRLAALFSSMCELEAAAVPAFRRLQSELVAHGAPAALVARAARAELDEVRHVQVKAHPARSLVEIACENAAEGCVRETYGALLAAWQAETAGDPAVRRSMNIIARDESRHAELAWDIDRWAQPQLDESESAKVKAARKEAMGELSCELTIEPAEEVSKQAGAPTAEQALMLAAQLSRELWA